MSGKESRESSRMPALIKGQLPYETRIWLYAFLVGAPGTLAALVLLFYSDLQNTSRIPLALLLIVFLLLLTMRMQREVVYHLQTLANLLEALREGDYSLRGRRARSGDALGEVVWEVNELSKTLREQRLEAREASALLQKVIGELDVAVFAFDGERRLRLVNRAGERLLGRQARQVLGHSAKELSLEDLLAEDGRRILQRRFAAGTGRWDVWRGSFRDSGRPHDLLVISDLSNALREEERKAWQRLIRVIGHELNNSLAPIKSMATTLKNTVDREQLQGEWHEDLQAGLSIIADRSESLSRFMSAYAMLAKLPAPRRKSIELKPLITRIARMEPECHTELSGDNLHLHADPDQLEQLLINLHKNAIDATAGSGKTTIAWRKRGSETVIEVLDEGPGIANPDNLFVPFFTTKPGGTGIGLVLCQQIAEAHGGTLSLENRPSGKGCVARLVLPR